MTNAEFVTIVLRRLGVLSEVENASAEQGAQGMAAMNAFMASWEDDGLDVGYYPQTDLSDDIPLPLGAILPAQEGLGTLLAIEYGKPIPPAPNAQRFFERTMRDNAVRRMTPASMDHLSRGEGQDTITSLF